MYEPERSKLTKEAQEDESFARQQEEYDAEIRTIRWRIGDETHIHLRDRLSSVGKMALFVEKSNFKHKKIPRAHLRRMAEAQKNCVAHIRWLREQGKI